MLYFDLAKYIPIQIDAAKKATSKKVRFWEIEEIVIKVIIT